jgi:hypothetical protein
MHALHTDNAPNGFDYCAGLGAYLQHANTRRPAPDGRIDVTAMPLLIFGAMAVFAPGLVFFLLHVASAIPIGAYGVALVFLLLFCVLRNLGLDRNRWKAARAKSKAAWPDMLLFFLIAGVFPGTLWTGIQLVKFFHLGND